MYINDNISQLAPGNNFVYFHDSQVNPNVLAAFLEFHSLDQENFAEDIFISAHLFMFRW